MAKNHPQPVIEVTPGKNKKVDNVILFEELVSHLQAGAASSARTRAAATHKEPLTKVKELASELERELRAIRASDKTKPRRARRGK